jgi:two-component system response regulator YesN
MLDILVVDDEPLVLLTIKSLCDWSSHGVRIAHECGNGKLALEYLREHPGTDIVLTDVDMPVMDGLALAEAMESEGIGASVVFLSSYSNFEYVRRAFKSGACDYILKVELDETRIVDLFARIAGSRADRVSEHVSAALHSGSIADPGLRETNRMAYFKRILGTDDADPDNRADFASCGFLVDFPFSFMILRPGDMPLVRQRYTNSLFDFQKTVSDLLLHFVPNESGESGAVSFDLYYVLMRDAQRLDNAFDLFYEAAWAYMDVGFGHRVGGVASDAASFESSFAACVRDFASPSRIVVRTRRFIREHYANSDLGLADIAEYSEVSRNHLSWEFARETGENVSDFIARTRMQEAKKLLLETNLRTYEIAERVGYSNVETFCRAFRKLTGTSPRQFS